MLDRIPTHLILDAEDIYRHQAGRADIIRQLRHAQIDDPEFAHQRQQLIERLENAVPDTRPMIHR